MTEPFTFRFRLALCLAIGLAVAGCSPPNPPDATASPAAAGVPTNDDFSHAAPLESVTTPAGTFFTKPYLQLGDSPTAAGALAVVWHVPGTNASGSNWLVETRSPITAGAWKKQSAKIRVAPVATGGIAAHTVVTANITGLEPGRPFDYRISQGGKPVFEARANQARPDSQPYHLVLFGNDGAGTAAQKKIAYQVSLVKPDAVVLTGNMVMPSGRASEYRDHFFPVYNADSADAKTGAPLMRSTLFVGAGGDSDLAATNLSSTPDGLAYYYYWQQPKNGFGAPSASSDHPAVTGNSAAFLKAAGTNYPHGANFSFNYGNARIVVLDSRPSVDWTDPGLQKKLRDAIGAWNQATWRFVVVPDAPFHSSEKSQDDQWMRVLAPVFADCHVDVVFSSHVNNYQRSYPLFFSPIEAREASGKIRGKANIDSSFDGNANTHLNGVLYVVSGAGGANLDNGIFNGGAPAGTLLPFSSKVIADKHSFTLATVNDHTLTLRQIDEDGKDIDLLTVAK